MNNLKLNSEKGLRKLLFVLPFIFLSSYSVGPAFARSLPVSHLQADSTTLKAFEGIYQQKDNQYAYFRISIVNDSLVAKQVDGDRQIKLTRKSDLGFQMPDDDGDEMVPVVFSKNGNGEITQALVGGRQLWVKVKNYVPVQEVTLSAAQLKTFEGKYQFVQKQDAFVQITATPGGLSLKQSWDGREIAFIAIGDDTFLNKQAGFPLKFFKDQNGNVIKLLAFNRDTWNKVN